LENLNLYLNQEKITILNLSRIVQLYLHLTVLLHYKIFKDHKQERVQNSFVQNEQNCHAVTKSVLATNDCTLPRVSQNL